MTFVRGAPVCSVPPWRLVRSAQSGTTSPRYRVLAKWATGGMADIYVARQQGAGGFDKLVALKVLRDVGEDAEFREMFLDGLQTRALVNPPTILETSACGGVGR